MKPSLWKSWRIPLATLGVVLALLPRGARAADGGEEVGLKLEVDKRQLQVGESLEVTVEFRRLGPGGGGFEGPSIPSPDKFEIRGTSSSTRVIMVNNQMAQVATTHFRLVATTAGEATVGPALAIYEDPRQGRREIKSNTAVVTVTEKKAFSFFGSGKKAEPAAAVPTPVSPAADDLRDIHGLAPLPSFPWGPLFWLGVFLLAAWWVWRRWFRRKASASAPADPGPAVELRERFKRLQRDEAPGLEFCRSASLLSRDCLKYRYGFSAADRTTSEILREMDRLKAGSAARETVEKCLRTCDRVLYAEGTLGPASREAVLSALSGLLPKAGKGGG